VSEPLDIALLSRQIARSATRLAKLIEINAPAPLIEYERRLLSKRVAAFPVASPEDCAQADAFDRIGKEEHAK
jgi:hypothetical protein